LIWATAAKAVIRVSIVVGLKQKRQALCQQPENRATTKTAIALIQFAQKPYRPNAEMFAYATCKKESGVESLKSGVEGIGILTPDFRFQTLD